MPLTSDSSETLSYFSFILKIPDLKKHYSEIDHNIILVSAVQHTVSVFLYIK